jgi:hypothetical protein
MKAIEYKTAYGSSTKELDERVNAMLLDGFQPFGNPYLSDQEVEGKVDTFVIWQAMVKYGEDARS